MKATNKIRAAAALLCGTLFLSGCVVGPHYHRASVDTPGTFKEVTPDDLKKMDGWKVAQPQDSALHGKWWEIFGDSQLNALEEQVSINNQNVAAAFANFMAARALVREARAQYFPTLTGGVSVTPQHQPGAASNVAAAASGSTFTAYDLPFDASWTPDLWGRVRNQVRANVANAQASAADLENTRLTAQAELAVDYFQLRGQDALKQLLDATVKAYEESLNLTKALYETGIDSDESVAQAETQLEATRAQDTNLGILRAQYEHAMALLIGKPASSFSVALEPLKTPPPAIPIGIPSQLLERRPDIAANERLMAQANALIGVQQAAYYPTVTISASAGFQSTSGSSWFTWPSRFWSVGPALSQLIYDGGLRRATVEQYRAQYDQAVANYRNTVLTAFQQVEDNLSGLRVLSEEIQQQDVAIQSAQRSLTLATDRYRLGIDPYLNVITAQTTLFSNQQTAVNLRITQIVDSVQLVEALGGGWDASTLPTSQQIISRATQASPTTTAESPATQPAPPASTAP
ncbi:MAG TPA: efflux transporter outer membrane subunit [Terriglobales bacterium]|jgi:NodT family efflux transporter outer membrane factor (OMF) lipoprotein|nr:efflux transporter outer membrane subunit [Terriglobales bacterium]